MYVWEIHEDVFWEITGEMFGRTAEISNGWNAGENPRSNI